MRKITLLLVLLIGMVFMANLASAETIKATHTVEWADAEGDVTNLDDPGKDVVKVSITSDGKEFSVIVTLKDDLKHYLEGHKAGAVIQLHFDMDNNKGTGGEIFWTKNTGFEYVISLRSCIRYEKGEACIGGFDDPITGFFSSYSTK